MRILRYVTRVLDGKGAHPPLSLGMVSDETVALVLRETGRSIAGYERMLESSDVRHAVASHGNVEKERARGQNAITKQDFARIPMIVDLASVVRLRGLPKSARTQRLEYHAVIGVDRYVYVEEIRPRSKIVALKTMRKS